MRVSKDRGSGGGSHLRASMNSSTRTLRQQRLGAEKGSIPLTGAIVSLVRLLAFARVIQLDGLGDGRNGTVQEVLTAHIFGLSLIQRPKSLVLNPSACGVNFHSGWMGLDDRSWRGTERRRKGAMRERRGGLMFLDITPDVGACSGVESSWKGLRFVELCAMFGRCVVVDGDRPPPCRQSAKPVL